ncbi:hypothetical protein KKD42_04235 [Patescibacteria group bacterium]|nr:hypothetical protein [Patescibacteria group bacterium]
MLSFRQVLAFIAALLVILTSAASASARTPTEKHFVVAIDDFNRVVQSGRYSDAGAIVSAFQGVFKNATNDSLTLQTLFAANRLKMIPACYPFQGKNVSYFRSAGDDSVWNDCPIENQRLVIVPSSGRINIPLEAAADNARSEARIRQLERNNAKLVEEKTQLASDKDRLVKEKAQLKQSTDDLKASLKTTQAESQTQKRQEENLQHQITSLTQRNEQLAEKTAPRLEAQGWLAVSLFMFAAFMVGLILGRFRKRQRPVARPLFEPDLQPALDRAATMNAELSAEITQREEEKLALEQEKQALQERAERTELEKQDMNIQLTNANALLEKLTAKASEGKPALPPKKKPDGNGEKERFLPKPPTATPVAEVAPSPAAPATVESLEKYRALRDQISELKQRLEDSDEEVKKLRRWARKQVKTEVPAAVTELQAKLTETERAREKAQKRANGTFKKWEESQAALAALEERLSELEGREKRQQTAV